MINKTLTRIIVGTLFGAVPLMMFGETRTTTVPEAAISGTVVEHAPEGVKVGAIQGIQVRVKDLGHSVRVAGETVEKYEGFHMKVHFAGHNKMGKEIKVQNNKFSVQLRKPTQSSTKPLEVTIRVTSKNSKAKSVAISKTIPIVKENSSLYGYAYIANNGMPSRWDPCQPIYYKVNSKGMPEGWRGDINKAFRLLSEASGYTFIDAGTTNKIPFSKEGEWERNTITIAFNNKETVPSLKDYLAVGGGVSLPTKGHIIAGSIVVNLEKQKDVMPGFSTRRLAFGRILLHELGHVMNLSHVEDDRQVMYEYVLPLGGANSYQGGDRAGFASLRSLGCFANEE